MGLLVIVLGFVVFVGCTPQMNNQLRDWFSDYSQGDYLVGTWEWDMNPDWRYVFNGDGTGTRGLPGYMHDSFVWWVNGSNLRIDMTAGTTFNSLYRNDESWTFTINGNFLTLSSRQEIGMTWTYARAN